MNTILRCILLALCSGALANAADNYPIKPIRLVVPWVAGVGANDFLGRLLAQRLTDLFGQNVVVDNRPGAGGVIGSDMVAKAAPDGYTLLLGTNGPIAVSQHLLKKMPYDPLKDLVPVALFAITPYVLVVNPAVPAKNLKELIALAKTKPGNLLYASSGMASTPHVCAELLKMMAGIDMTHVPFKGGAPAHLDTVAGRVQVYCAGLSSQLPQIKAGRLRAIGVTTPQRSALTPEIATISEQGLDGFDVNAWGGVMAPAGLPGPVMRRLQQAIAQISERQEWKSYLENQGFDPVYMDSKKFGDYIRNESAKWGKVVRETGMTSD